MTTDTEKLAEIRERMRNCDRYRELSHTEHTVIEDDRAWLLSHITKLENQLETLRGIK